MKTDLDGHREGEKQIWRNEEDKKKIIMGRRQREGDVSPLCPGLKLIGPGLEEIIYKKNTEILYKALHRSGFHGDSLLCNSATGKENKTSC